MNERSNEVIKQLTRLANDRNLPIQARNKILAAARHIKDLRQECRACQQNLSETYSIDEIRLAN